MRSLLLASLAAAATLLAAGCGTTGTVAKQDVGTGKALFQQNCAQCHTLADAKAKGTVGPNLDEALGHPMQQGFDESTIRDVVRGQIAYASPPMPRDLVEGKEADAVASYVAAVAGRPVQGGGVKAAPLPGSETTTAKPSQPSAAPKPKPAAPSGGGNAAAVAAGKQVFETAGCAGCHTLKDAGASGNVGPNLDQLAPDQPTVAHQVENGGGAMPAYKGQLTPKQIDDVATYVSSVAGK